MRFLATLLLWLITTVALAVAIPTAWAQRNLVDPDGYAALAQQASADPALQAAVAAELSTRVIALIDQRGYQVRPARVHAMAASYTTDPSFPAQFAQANRLAHDRMFTGGSDSWTIDLAPMLRDRPFQQLLTNNHVDVPESVPVTVTPPDGLRPGTLQPLARWGRWASLGVVALAGGCALLTLISARSRGKALASLGVSALVVGAGGWAGIEVARRFVDEALNPSTGNIRQIADVMVAQAEGGLHHWLNLTLATGGVLVVFGVLVAILGGLRGKA